jgi:hypothetical protein
MRAGAYKSFWRLFHLFDRIGANMKLFLAVLALSTLPVMAADTSAAKVSGYISDSMCGAKHNGSAPDAACVKKCIGGGAKPVFVDDANKTVYTIDDPDSVKGHEGHHVSVVAKMDDSAKTIHITKLSMLADQGKATGTSEMH